ncbi:MAG: DUF4394 domain-containing protein [Burkholderiaceae bacterium]|nr:DUF4394 domain-containing protein [Burkholderiaceae bacterium]
MPSVFSPRRRPLLGGLAAASLALLSACASLGDAEPPPVAMKHSVVAVTDQAELVRFNPGQPQQWLGAPVKLQGLAAGERLLGIDFRISRGVLFGLTSGGRLVTIDTASGRLSPVGSGAPLALPGGGGGRYGFDFNPAADRVRVVAEDGSNLRLHPDTGAVAATDPNLRYAEGDARAGQAPRVTAAGYTYNKRDDKLTTNYALDIAAGSLVMQGSLEGTTPVVSPNTGLLRTVGALGTGAVDDAAFDIADVDNTALAALRVGGRTRLHRVDLATGRATLLGTVGQGRALWGMAIEP